MLLFMPNSLQMIVHLREQRLPLFARKAKDWVITAHPALDRIVQVGSCFGFLPYLLNVFAFSGFALLHFVEADEGGCAEEIAEDGFAADFEEAG